MTDEEKAEKTSEEERCINIDYENIDVADIMDQIKKKIASRPEREPEPPIGAFDDGPYAEAPPEMPPEASGTRSKVKFLLLKIMKPFSPLIRLLILPVSHELAETVKILDHTRRELVYLYGKLDYELSQLYGKLERVDKTVNERIDLAFDDIGRIKEYTKLLHSLSHNVVVEMTKLKIEEENLKIRARILEKDFEFLGQREKALEDQALK